ncbi:MAG TPA: CBS domain-containing protein [Nitrospiria bacterium]|nr:CBS domain-containing protein [Nitrospiria bacterium]
MKPEKKLSRGFLSAHPGEAAKVLERFSPEDTSVLLEKISPGEAGRIMVQMGESFARMCLERMAPPKAASVFSQFPRERSAALIRGMDPKKRDPLLAELSPAASQSVKTLLRFPKGTAGAVMDSRVLSFTDDLPVHQVLQRIRQNPGQITHYAYVVDRTGILVGVTTLTELMLFPVRSPLRSVMKTPVEHLSVLDNEGDIIGHRGWKRFHKLPVVDRSGKFLGVVRYKTLRGLEGRTFEPGNEKGFSPLFFDSSRLLWNGLGLTVFVFAAFMRSAVQESDKKSRKSP